MNSEKCGKDNRSGCFETVRTVLGKWRAESGKWAFGRISELQNLSIPLQFERRTASLFKLQAASSERADTNKLRVWNPNFACNYSCYLLTATVCTHTHTSKLTHWASLKAVAQTVCTLRYHQNGFCSIEIGATFWRLPSVRYRVPHAVSSMQFRDHESFGTWALHRF